MANHRTVLITNGNTLSMLSLGGWLKIHGKDSLVAIFLTTKLPSADSNLKGIIKILEKSGFHYTFFKLWVNRLLPLYLKFKRLPFDVPSLCRYFGIDIPIHRTENINTPEIISRIKGYAPEIILSFSATQKFDEEVFAIASRVTINAHFSLLPAYAGLSPYFWYLNNGEKICGSTLHIIQAKLDAGPVIEQDKFEILNQDSVMQIAFQQAEGISGMLNRFYDGKTSEKNSVPQDLGLRSYFKHPDKKVVEGFLSRGFKFIKKDDTHRVVIKIHEIMR